ncbi:MAG TPA: hypothetical protein VLA14_06715 [Polyangia bacterium]|jgi:hypothetical protein|nr:hypothetical protein [Polyangia bacterium]
MRKVAAAVALACATLACGRLKPAADASVSTDAASTDADARAPRDAADASPEAADASPEAADAPPEAEPVSAGRTLPASVHPAVRFFDASAILVGNDANACTHQIPASGDGHRWCGFIVGAGPSGVAALWVVDVTRAATGDVPACDGADPGCLRLSDKVDTRGAAFFYGDTLFYGTDNAAPLGQDFLGPLFAWRPGWSTGRQVSSNAGVGCVGNTRSAAVACLDDPDGTPAKRDSVNVSAGYLLAQTGDPLPSFGRWPLRNDSNTAWQAGFSPDGSIFVLADADTIGAPRTLRLSPTTDVSTTTPAPTLEDVLDWQISNDGQKIYFSRTSPTSRDLYIADFPTGANTQLLETDVPSFALLGDAPTDQAVAIQKGDDDVGGVVEFAPDRSVAPKVLFHYTGVLNGAIVSPDLRYTTWLDDSFRATVFRNADLASCVIDDDPADPVYEPSYLASAGLMFWKEIAPGGNSSLRDAFFAAPDACRAKHQFGTHVDLIKPVGDRGVVFSDGLDPMTGQTTLKYVAVSPDGSTLDPQGAFRIRDGVSEPVVVVGADPPLLVFASQGATADDSGLYVFGPVTF